MTKFLSLSGLQTFWGDIVQMASDKVANIQTMTANIKGGAKLGDGLRVDNDTLSIGNLVHSGSGAEVVTDGCAIYSVDGQGWAEQDGTPTPENPVEIRVARGRNLLPPDERYDGMTKSVNGITFTANADGSVTINGTASADATYALMGQSTAENTIKRGESYTLSHDGDYSKIRCGFYSASGESSSLNRPRTFTIPLSGNWNCNLQINSGTTVSNVTVHPQLELGTTPTPYVPYGCVGLEVTHDGTATVTPIPLPTKGFAASLPDGTADALAIDSAGKWEWGNVIGDYTVTGSEATSSNKAISETIYRSQLSNVLQSQSVANSDYGYCSHAEWLRSWSGNSVHAYTSGGSINLFAEGTSTADVLAAYTGATILYQLATPTTESGYIDPPALLEGATVSIPELREIGCSWFIAGVDELARHAANWGKRALASESRIAALESAVAELATS